MKIQKDNTFPFWTKIISRIRQFQNVNSISLSKENQLTMKQKEEKVESLKDETSLNKLLAFDLLLDRMREAYQIEDSSFEKQGYADGLKLGDPKLGEAQIKHIFQAGQTNEEALSRFLEAKIKAANQRKVELQNDIKRLKEDLDEKNPNSKAYVIEQRISEYQIKLQEDQEYYFKKMPENKQIERILKARIDNDLKQLGLQQTQQQMLFDELTSQFSIVSEGLKNDLKNHSVAKETQQKALNNGEGNHTQTPSKIDNESHSNYLAKAKESMASLHDLYESSCKSLKQQNAGLRIWYNEIIEQLQEDLPKVPSRLYIWTIAIFLVIVLFGEIYLINEMTSKIFGVNPDGNGIGFLPSQFYVTAHILFCIAYPISLGMVVKYFLSQKRTQDRKLYSFAKNLFRLAGILIACVALLNVFGKESVIETLESLKLEWDYEIFLIPVNTGAFLGISCVFSFVSGFMFLDFFNAYDLYLDRWEVSPFEAKPAQTKDQKYFKNHQKVFKKAIKSLKKEKFHMVKELKEKEALLLNQETDIICLPKDWHFKSVWDHLKKASIAAYLRGYQKGRIERQEKSGYDDLLDYYRKSKITQNYPSPLMNIKSA